MDVKHPTVDIPLSTVHHTLEQGKFGNIFIIYSLFFCIILVCWTFNLSNLYFCRGMCRVFLYLERVIRCYMN